MLRRVAQVERFVERDHGCFRHAQQVRHPDPGRLEHHAKRFDGPEEPEEQEFSGDHRLVALASDLAGPGQHRGEFERDRGMGVQPAPHRAQIAPRLDDHLGCPTLVVRDQCQGQVDGVQAVRPGLGAGGRQGAFDGGADVVQHGASACGSGVTHHTPTAPRHNRYTRSDATGRPTNLLRIACPSTARPMSRPMNRLVRRGPWDGTRAKVKEPIHAPSRSGRCPPVFSAGLLTLSAGTVSAQPPAKPAPMPPKTTPYAPAKPATLPEPAPSRMPGAEAVPALHPVRGARRRAPAAPAARRPPGQHERRPAQAAGAGRGQEDRRVPAPRHRPADPAVRPRPQGGRRRVPAGRARGHLRRRPLLLHGRLRPRTDQGGQGPGRNNSRPTWNRSGRS